ncbi:hypothetical protein ACHAW6_001700 [Cyclotella cf. meneghiniana]
MPYNAVTSHKPDVNANSSQPCNTHGSVGKITGQQLSMSNGTSHISLVANAAVDNEQWSSQMTTSLNNLANAAVQKNDTVERLVLANKLLTNTVAKLQEDNAKLLTVIQQLAGPGHTHRPPQSQGGMPKWDPKGYCHTHGYRVSIGHTSKTC